MSGAGSRDEIPDNVERHSPDELQSNDKLQTLDKSQAPNKSQSPIRSQSADYPRRGCVVPIRLVVREPGMGDEDIFPDEKLRALLALPLWPEFIEGVYLNSHQASRLYRSVQGLQALVHILDRSAHLRGRLRDLQSYEKFPESFDTAEFASREAEQHRATPLGEFEESRLRAAVIQLAEELARIGDDLLAQESTA